MKKTLCFLIFVAAFALLGSKPTYAVPVIDGILSAGEWDLFNAVGLDPNEALIPDAYDLSSMKVLFQNAGGASDGIYVLLQTYATPSLVDTGIGPPPALIAFLLDSNGDLDFADNVDFYTEHKLSTGFDVFDGTDTQILNGVEGTHYKLGSVIEYYIPSSALLGFPYLNVSTFALYDNGGNAPDDRLPDLDFVTNTPEPATLFLLGSGLLSLLGLGKRFSA